MGNTCKPMADSFQCMTKFTRNKKKKEKVADKNLNPYRPQQRAWPLHVSVLMSSSLWLSKPSLQWWCHSTVGWASPHQRNQQDPGRVHQTPKPASSLHRNNAENRKPTDWNRKQQGNSEKSKQASLLWMRQRKTTQRSSFFLHSSHSVAKQPGTYPRHMSPEANQLKYGSKNPEKKLC